MIRRGETHETGRARAAHPWRIALVWLVLLCPIVARDAGAQGAPSGKGRTNTVATIGDDRVTEEQLEALARERLARLRTEEYQIKKQVLDEYVARSLMEREAKARGISLDKLQVPVERHDDAQALHLARCA